MEKRIENIEKSIEAIQEDQKEMMDNHIHTIEIDMATVKTKQVDHGKLLWWIMGLIGAVFLAMIGLVVAFIS